MNQQEETKNNSYHIEKLIFINVLENCYVLCASESQDIEIVNFNNFRSVYKFQFKSSYGHPKDKSMGANAAAKGAKTF